MAVKLSSLAGAGWQFFTDAGVPLAGGKLYTYAAGTTTPTATYTTNLGDVPQANPIVLDSAGRVPSEIWLTEGTTYKFVLKTSTDTTIGTWDNIDSVNNQNSITKVTAAVGSVSAPSYTFSGRTSDGLYSPATNAVAVTVNGVEQLRATTSGVTLSGGYLSAQPTIRNRIINGTFDFWQRATSQTSTGYGSDDRWSNGSVGSTKTASRQAFTVGQTDVPGNPTYFSRTTVTSVAGAGNFVIKQQRIEGVRTFSGKTVTLSFWAKADVIRYIAMDLNQYFGTGGSPSVAVDGIGAQKFLLSTGWQQFTATVAVPSISGKTIGTNGDDFFELTFWFDAGANYNARSASLGQQSGTFDIAMVQLEEGSAATSYELRPPEIELSLCQRYFCQGFIGGNAGSGVNVRYIGAVTPFPVTMRGTPVVTIFDLVGNSGKISTANGDDFSISSGAVSAIQTYAVLTDVILGADPGNWWRATYSATAELA